MSERAGRRGEAGSGDDAGIGPGAASGIEGKIEEQAEVEGWGGVRERADRDEVRTDVGHGANGAQVDVSSGLDFDGGIGGAYEVEGRPHEIG